MRSLAIDTRQHTIFRILNTVFRILNTVFRILNTVFRILNTIFRMRRGLAIPFSLHGIEAGRRSSGIDIK